VRKTSLHLREWLHNAESFLVHFLRFKKPRGKLKRVPPAVPAAVSVGNKPAIPEDLLAKWQSIVDLLADIINVPAALITRVKPPKIEVFLSSASEGNPYGSGDLADLGTGLYCETVMEKREPLLVPNALEDPVWIDNPDVSLGVISCLGFPLEWPDGEIFGTICVLDNKANPYSDTYKKLMAEFKASIEGDLATIVHVEEVKHMHGVLERENTLLSKTMQLAQLGNWTWDIVNNRLSWSGETYKIFGLAPQIVKAPFASFIEVVHPEDRNQVINAINKALAGELTQIDHRIMRPSGEVRYVHESVEALIDDEGKPILMVGTIHDITERKNAAEVEALQKSEEHFRALIENSSDTVTILDLDGTIRYKSPSVENMLGYTPAEMVGRPITDYIQKGDIPRLQTAMEKIVQEPETTYPIEIHFRHKNGSWRYLEAKAKGLIKGGELSGVVVNTRDITKRKIVEEALRESEARYSTVIESSPGYIFLINRRGNILDLDMPREQSGAPEVLVTSQIYDYVCEEDREPFKREFEACLDTKSIREFDVRSIDKSLTYQVLLAPIRNHAGESDTVVCNMYNITERKAAENKLREQEDKFRRLVESVPDIIYSFSDKRGGIYYSPHAEKILGYPLEQLYGNPLLWHDSIHPEDLEKIDAIIEKMPGGQPYEVEYRIKNAAGEWRWLLDRSFGWRRENDEIVLDGIATDITERKRAKEALEQHINELTVISEVSTALSRCENVDDILRSVGEKIYDLSDNSQVIVTLSDRTSDTIRIREYFGFSTHLDSVLKTIGKDPRDMAFSAKDMTEEERKLYTSGRLEIMPGGLYDLLTRKIPKKICNAVEKILGIDRIYTMGFALGQTPFGGIIIMMPKAVPLRYQSAIEAIVKQASAIIQRRWAEEALARSETRFRTLIEDGQDLVLLIDKTTTIKYASPSVAQVLGYQPEELEGQRGLDLVHPEDIPVMTERLSSVIETPQERRPAEFRIPVEFRIHHRDGTWRLIEALGNNKLDNPAIGAIVLIGHDITERKRAEEALIRTNRALKLLSECNLALVRAKDEIQLLDTTCKLIVDIGGYRLAWVGLAEHDRRKTVRPVSWMGYEEGYLETLKLTWADTERGRAPGGTAIRTGEPVVARDIPNDPAYAVWRKEALKRGYASSIGLPLKIDDQAIGALNIYAPEPDAFIEEEVQLLQELADDLAYGIMALRAQVERKQAEEALRESEDRYRTVVEGSPSLIFLLNRDGNILDLDMPRAPGHGPEILVSSHIYDYVYEGDQERFKDEINVCLATGTIHEFEIRNFDQTITYQVLLAPIKSWGGEPRGLVCNMYDITERKKMEADLLKVEKLESLEILAAGLAHDFNNFLMGILMNISSAQLMTEGDEKVQDSLMGAIQSIDRAKAITRQLMTYTRGQEAEKVSTYITPLLKEAVKFSLHGTSIRPYFSIDDDLWMVEIDTGQINQVISNLCINAVHAMPQGGDLHIRASNETLVPGHTVGRLKSGDYAKISIQDGGMGIPQEIIDKIFDPYYTTKTEGSGLGLYSCHSIIKSHGGWLTVDTELGMGSTFSFYLPRVFANQEKKGSIPARGAIEGNRRILIVDDEESTRRGMSEVLRKKGYIVEDFATGEQAIDHLKKATHHEPYDVVILDLIIPGGMGGKEILDHIKEIAPDVKALATSGAPMSPIVQNPTEYGFTHAIVKPFTVEHLCEVIEQTLTEKSA